VVLPYGEQILWPDHCVAGTPGADFPPGARPDPLRTGDPQGIPPGDRFVFGLFRETTGRRRPGWPDIFASAGLVRLFLVGLATDFCVAYSALDARRLGFEVTVIEAGCRGIDIAGSLAAAWKQMEEGGRRPGPDRRSFPVVRRAFQRRSRNSAVPDYQAGQRAEPVPSTSTAAAKALPRFGATSTIKAFTAQPISTRKKHHRQDAERDSADFFRIGQAVGRPSR
jgi:hypothetical protein